MKKLLACLAALLLLPALALGDAPLRGYVKGEGYLYVLLGRYPYEADGTQADVLWRVLEAQDGQALLLTEYVVDVCPIIFETDPEVIEAHAYRRIAGYAESDLCAHLNADVLDALLGEDPVRAALMEEGDAGRLFILTDEQYLRSDYGFTENRWGVQRTRQAQGTPYALARGLYRDYSTRACPYWAAAIKSAEGTHMQLVGYDGHLSWGAYTRQNVGLRLAVRLDLSLLETSGGAGTQEDPFRLAALDGAPEASSEPEASPEPDASPEPEASPAPEATTGEADSDAQADGVTLSFVGDCSVGDSIQYRSSSSSYHACVDENGADWPLSLVRDVLLSDDLTLANLEVVFTERTKHSGKMYNLVADADHTDVLTQGGIDLVNTVNNHCLDFGIEGYGDSLAVLDAAGIDNFGSIYPWQDYGYDRMAVKEIRGITFGFIGFSYPGRRDVERITNRIAALREQGCDVVVVSLHWGREEKSRPDASQMEYARQILDAGADAIWGHHPHVLQPIQFYKGKPILYSTGNFTFGAMSPVDPATGIFQLTYEKTEAGVQLARVTVVPCMMQTRSLHIQPRIVQDEDERREVFARLVLPKVYDGFDNPPESFLQTGVIQLENGQILP